MRTNKNNKKKRYLVHVVSDELHGLFEGVSVAAAL